jgi:hypothetical protein
VPAATIWKSAGTLPPSPRGFGGQVALPALRPLPLANSVGVAERPPLCDVSRMALLGQIPRLLFAPSHLGDLMWKWFRRLLIGLVVAALIVIGAGPWLLYRIGLRLIDGRPGHASHATVAPQDVQDLWRKLRVQQPVRIEPLSPHGFFWAMLSGEPRAPGPAAILAWQIAREHNWDHLADRQAWHLSGAALTIWLTRNWTENELVAKAVELGRNRRAD